ncbi:hypothetical protein [Streptomyces sp. NBC_01314]|uniref:hypothetical protein n=1 Tax=Streptomyces sp. NBC_01314 TaxID=2903821 RepID=UPI003092D4D8|nr:hypothetical protein OG622_11830 [Streptomyces sp. NBC_01314]
MPDHAEVAPSAGSASAGSASAGSASARSTGRVASSAGSGPTLLVQDPPSGPVPSNPSSTSAAADYLVGRNPKDPTVVAQAGLEAYSTAYWWSAVFFVAGVAVSFLLYRRGAPVQDPDAAPAVHM